MSATPEVSSSSPKPRESTWGSSSGSNLYLATFLATLFLLLIGSCCIVIRSYVMRRRMRRHLREIFSGDGLATTPARCRCRKRRPKFHDKWIAPAASASWGDIMPLSLRVVFGKRAFKPEDPRLEARSESRRLGLKGWTSSSCGSSQSAQQDGTDTSSPKTKFEIAQVSVLIRMPSPDHSILYGCPRQRLKSTEDDDDELEGQALPELAIGFARCHKHWWMDVVTEVANTKEQNTDTHQPK